VVAGAQTDIVFDHAVVFIEDPVADCTLAGRLSGTHAVHVAFADSVPAPPGMTRLRILVSPAGGAFVPFTDGEIASCTFRIDPAAAPGTYVLQADKVASSDAAGNGFTTTGSNGSITVPGGCGCS
jgi:hypothetical protein